MNDIRIVVYTAVFDDYDLLTDPEYTHENLDYICFTDNPDSVTGVWEPRVVSEYNISSKLMSGKVKTNPHEFFSEYDYSIWIDGNVQITGDPEHLIKTYLSDTSLAVPSHPERNCIYKEGEVCISNKKADEKNIRDQLDRYREHGFPEEYGLSETRVLFREHNDENVINCMEIWWEEYRNGAERDQLSFEYAIWRSDLDYEQINLTYDNESGFLRHPHRLPDSPYTDLYDLFLYMHISGPKSTRDTIRLLLISIRVLDQRGIRTLLSKLFNRISRSN